MSVKTEATVDVAPYGAGGYGVFVDGPARLKQMMRSRDYYAVLTIGGTQYRGEIGLVSRKYRRGSDLVLRLFTASDIRKLRRAGDVDPGVYSSVTMTVYDCEDREAFLSESGGA